MSEEFAVGYVERLREVTAGRAYTDNWWGDSYTPSLDRFWRNKLRACPDFLKVQDPDLFKVGAQRAKDWVVANGKPVLLGVSNNLLQDGPVEAIQERVHEYLEIAEPGGYSLVYFCNFGALAPAEHVRAAVDAVRRYRDGDRPWVGERKSGKELEDPDTKIAAETKSLSVLPGIKSVEGLDEDQEQLLDDIFDTVVDGSDDQPPELVQRALETGIHHNNVLDNALIAAMEEVGDQFADGSIFVPEMLLSARAMKGGLEVLRPILSQTKSKPKGLVVLATVQGDVHDIGKNLVGMMLEGAGFKVVDIGVNISPEQAIERAQELNPDVIGLSALLTTTMPAMGKIIDAFRTRGCDYPIIVGGAPVSPDFARLIRADGYAENAPEAVRLVKQIVASASRTEHDLVATASGSPTMPLPRSPAADFVDRLASLLAMTTSRKPARPRPNRAWAALP